MSEGQDNRSAGAADGAVAPTAFFSRTYDEALALTREARDYLAVYGVDECRSLPLDLQLHFSAETMRLTTRLTHVMAWLLAQRAAQQGELGYEELKEETWRLGGHEICLAAANVPAESLPPYLRDLLRRSESLFRRIARLDEMVAGQAA